jgi:hypothetical protein
VCVARAIEREETVEGNRGYGNEGDRRIEKQENRD